MVGEKECWRKRNGMGEEEVELNGGGGREWGRGGMKRGKGNGGGRKRWNEMEEGEWNGGGKGLEWLSEKRSELVEEEEEWNGGGRIN